MHPMYVNNGEARYASLNSKIKKMKKLFVIAMFSLILIESNAQQQTSFSVTVTGKGQPIILIPGFGCSGDVWKETVDH